MGVAAATVSHDSGVSSQDFKILSRRHQWPAHVSSGENPASTLEGDHHAFSRAAPRAARSAAHGRRRRRAGDGGPVARPGGPRERSAGQPPLGRHLGDQPSARHPAARDRRTDSPASRPRESRRRDRAGASVQRVRLDSAGDWRRAPGVERRQRVDCRRQRSRRDLRRLPDDHHSRRGAGGQRPGRARRGGSRRCGREPLFPGRHRGGDSARDRAAHDVPVAAGGFHCRRDDRRQHHGVGTYFLSGIEVLAAKRARAIVALGDSFTDGYRSTVDTNQNYPSLLAARLQAGPQHLAGCGAEPGRRRQSAAARLRRDQRRGAVRSRRAGAERCRAM